MHELWLCKNILSIINQKIAEKKYNRVTKIFLEIGQLAAIDKLSLDFSFKIIAQGTMVENVSLEIIDLPAKAICDFCKKCISIAQYYDKCSECGCFSLTIIQGEEFRVKSMEVE